MPSKWIGRIHKGQVGKRWSSREKAHRYDLEDKSYNAGRPEPTKEEWPSSVQRVRLPSVSTEAR